MRMHCLVLVMSWCAAALSAEAPRPNIIFILTDDQGYGDLSCHGNPVLKTPHIDRLHAEGVRLTNYHVSPTCAPTRCALLTGRHMGHAAIRDNQQRAPGAEGQHPMPRDTVTVAQLLKKSGYATGIIGK